MSVRGKLLSVAIILLHADHDWVIFDGKEIEMVVGMSFYHLMMHCHAPPAMGAQ
jgi:hypothetical protein